ncbi:putative ATP-dependent RNA helicase [ANME-1 cluster archaeon GoMg3.2]|nr:putative ATP-dependent RNA helicase [ANME-1 cluster archaeon GoMg3.2]
MSTNSSRAQDPLTILNSVFNHHTFRSRQEEIISNVLAQKNTLAILPTGVGKSICFQIPALIFDGLTVVVSPLIALMKDQVDNLKKHGIFEAAYINSMLDQATKERIHELLKESKLKMLYVAPETFVDNKLMSILKTCNISLIAIDEVHCISVWGHNFRPDYLRLQRVIADLHNPPPPVLGLTATATKTVEEDIQKQLGIECDVFKDSFDRKNLLFSVIPMKSNNRKELSLKRLLGQLKGSTIVYVNFTKTAEWLATYLADSGLSASYYHGQMRDSEERRRVQNDFINGRTRIVVATNAFGMGIDKEDIRAIIHYNLPKSIENYYQEVGRAGRDQNISNCILLYSKGDEIQLRKLIQRNTPSEEQIEAVLDLLTQGEGDLIYVNVKRLANELTLDEVPIRLILHNLERLGALKTYFKIFKRAVVSVQHADFGSLKYRHDAEKIYKNAYFNASLNRWMDLDMLSSAVQISVPRINNVLRELKTAGMIELVERDFCTPVKVYPGIKDVDIMDLLQILLRLETNSMKKIDTIVEYVESRECKRKFILNYFGEDYDGVCNACSVCNPLLSLIDDGFERSTEPQPELSPATVEEELLEGSATIAFSILELLRTLDFHVGRTFLANILTGSKSKRILDQNLQESRYYGILKGYTAEEARKIIDQMIAKGYLITKQGTSSYPRPQLYLTALAEKALKEQIPIELQLPVKKEEICETGNLTVLEALKEWRKRIAAENSIPAYCVFHDSTLIGIANRLPKTTQELQTIKGIGERKIENYGDEILKIVDEVE